MADYNTIKDTVAKFLRQISGDDATTLVPEFLEMAESTVYRRLRIPPMENITDLTTDLTDGFITLPADFLELKSLVIIDTANSKNTELEARPYGEVEGDTRTGTPLFYARKDNQIIFAPGPDAQKTVRMYYYRQFDPLTAASPNNYISNSAPDVLIYGALLEALPFAVANIGPERMEMIRTMWKKRFEAAMSEIEFQAGREWEGSRLSVR